MNIWITLREGGAWYYCGDLSLAAVTDLMHRAETLDTGKYRLAAVGFPNGAVFDLALRRRGLFPWRTQISRQLDLRAPYMETT